MLNPTVVPHWENLSLDTLSEEINGIVIIEKWKAIPDYEGLYEASTFGRIKSLRKVNYKGQLLMPKILRQADNGHGYCCVSLWNGGEAKTFSVQKLVTNTFLCVNHKNGNKKDNRLINVEYITHSENNYHSYRELNRINGMKGKFEIIRKDSNKVVQKNIDGSFVQEFDSIKIATNRTKIPYGNIHKCVNGERNTAGGFIWEFSK